MFRKPGVYGMHYCILGETKTETDAKGNRRLGIGADGCIDPVFSWSTALMDVVPGRGGDPFDIRGANKDSHPMVLILG